MFLSKCAAYISKKLRSIKVQEASGLLTNLGLKTPLSITPLLGDIFLKMYWPINIKVFW